MTDQFNELPPRIQSHLKRLTESSELPPGDESLARITENWTTKERLFQEQVEALDMRREERFASDDPRGALLLTYSGSLVTLGPLAENGRSFEYASIKLRNDVPGIVREEGVGVAKELECEKPAAFTGSTIEHTSELLTIASFDPSLEGAEQSERLRQATIFLTNGFVKANQSLSVEQPGGIDHFTMKSMVQYVAGRNGTTQKLARSVIDDFLATVESGALLGERVSLGRLGKLSIAVRSAQKARVGRNPATGEEITIPAKPEQAVPRFSFSSPLKERVAKTPVERLERE
jgi:nucleoid DNA-binding protein